MLDVLYPMALVLASWLFFFMLFTGLGSFAINRLNQRLNTGWKAFDAFWLGWALSLGILQLWHLAFPVNDAILLALAAIAFIRLGVLRHSLIGIVQSLRADQSFLLIFAAVSLWFSNRALGMPIAYDTGFRDMQAVMWLDTFPIVPGLGNLFSSLALNHSVYLYDALLDVSIWSGRSHYIATGLLFLVYLAYAVKALLALSRCGEVGDLRWSGLFATLTIPYVLFNTVTYGGFTHFLTDSIVDILGFVTLVYVLDFLQDWQPGNSDYPIYRLAIVLLAGFTVKQSFMLFGGIIGLFVVAVWLRRHGPELKPKRLARSVIPFAILALAFVIPWMARGVVTSGYIAFPQTIGHFDVDWAIPLDQLRERQLNMSVNTRLRDADRSAVLGSWEWLRPWLRNFADRWMPNLAPTLVAAGALVIYAAGLSRVRGRERTGDFSAWTLAPLLLTLMIWFFSFPEPKYVHYVLWSLASLSVMLAFFSWDSIAWRIRLATVFALTAAGLAYTVFLIIQLRTFPLPAGPDDGFYAHWVMQYDQFETESGLVINVPAEGRSQCWQIPLPCTPHPDAKVAARVPGELRHGFLAANTIPVINEDE